MLEHHQSNLDRIEVSVTAFALNVDPGGERYGFATVTSVPCGFEMVADPGHDDPQVILNFDDIEAALVAAVGYTSAGDNISGVGFVDANGRRVSMSAPDQLSDKRVTGAIDMILGRVAAPAH